jgi:outer membrane protein TolC
MGCWLHRFGRALFLCFCMGLSAPVLCASTVRADARNVSLAAALSAVEKAPAHIAAVRRSEAANARVAAAGAWPETNVSLSTNLRTARFSPALSFPLPVFGTLGADEQQARAESAVAAQVATLDGLGLQRSVHAAWLGLYRAEHLALLAEQSAQQAKQLADISTHRFDAGDAPRAEVVAAGAEQRRAEAEARAAAMSVAEASATLAGELGWPAEQALHADGALGEVALPSNVTPLLLRVQGHPQTRALKAEVSASHARVEVASHQKYPKLSLELEAAIDDPTLPGSDLRAGVGIALPLMGRGSEAENAARSEQRAAEADVVASQQALASQVVAAYRRCNAAQERARALRDDVLPAQREAARLAQVAYAEGQQRFSDVLQAERSRVDGERAVLDAAVELASALSDLEWAMGGPL